MRGGGRALTLCRRMMSPGWRRWGKASAVGAKQSISTPPASCSCWASSPSASDDWMVLGSTRIRLHTRSAARSGSHSVSHEGAGTRAVESSTVAWLWLGASDKLSPAPPLPLGCTTLGPASHLCPSSPAARCTRRRRRRYGGAPRDPAQLPPAPRTDTSSPWPSTAAKNGHWAVHSDFESKL